MEVGEIPKSWIHEGERAAEAKQARVDSIRRVLNTAELPGAVGGLALVFVGRKIAGASGKAIAAMGSTLLLSAIGNFAYRNGASRLTDYFRGLLPANSPAAEATP